MRGPSAETSSRIASGEKYMTAEGLPLVAALELVDALDRLGAERVAGEAVEAVGGEQRDAAAERRMRSSAARAAAAPSRSIETISVIATYVAMRQIATRRDALDRRRGRGALTRVDPSKPRLDRTSSARRIGACPVADLERDRGGPQLAASDSSPSSASIASSPVGPGDQRLARLVARDLGRQRRATPPR